MIMGTRQIGFAILVCAMILLNAGRIGAQNLPAASPMVLRACDAKVTGNLKIQGKAETATIHFWNKPDDLISWAWNSPKPGNYRVALNYSLGAAMKGGKILLVAHDQLIVAPAEPTGKWSDFRTFELGVVRVERAGEISVILQAAQLPQTPGAALPDVAWLSLAPTNAPATSKPYAASSASKNRPDNTVRLSASSVESGHPAEMAFDGSIATRWCAGSGALNEWLRIDFAAPKAVGGMETIWEFPGDEYGYTIEGSADGKAWKELAKATNMASKIRTKLSGTYRALRIKVTSLPQGKRWASISEVRIFDNQGKPIGNEQKTAIPD